MHGQKPESNRSINTRLKPASALRSGAENLWYRCRMAWMRNVDRQRLYRGRKVALDTAYRCVFEDEFGTFDRTRWRVGQPWGNIHPGNIHQWYSDEAVQADSGVLRLRAFHHRVNVAVNGRDTIVPYQVGLICSDISFSTTYGYFELRCKQPSGPAVWPAFWLAPVKGWPPEIDILEMYGKRRGRSTHRLTNSLHYGSIEAGTKGQTISGIRLPADTDTRFYVYGCLWKPDCIEFYVNGYMVRMIRLNNALIQAFNTPMYLIINNALQAVYLPNEEDPLPESAMEIDYVRVYTRGDM